MKAKTITLSLFLLAAGSLWSDRGGEQQLLRQSDGNRFAEGRGSLPVTSPVTVRVPGTPIWISGSAAGESSFWTVMLKDGQVLAFRLSGRSLTEIAVNPSRLPPRALPGPAGFAGQIDGNGRSISLLLPPEQASPFSSPVVLPRTLRTAYLTEEGDLVLMDQDRLLRLPVNALPDTRILFDESERILLLTGPTDRYEHGVLGDWIEAAGMTLIQTRPTLRVVRTIVMPETEVIEGLSPIWVDLNGDGAREIVVTVSDNRQGARLVVFDELGRRIASGPAIGQGRRWRHQLAIAPFGNRGQLEIADVLTPHIGGTVEYFRLGGDTLERTAVMRGYSTHRIASRNLGMALAGDLDGDGRIELLVPEQNFRTLAAIRRTNRGAEVAWTIPLDNPLSTNMGAAVLTGGDLVVGFGTAEGDILLWPSE